MAKPTTVKIKLVSTADTGFFYVTKKNPRTKTEKLSLSASTIPSCASMSSSRKPRSSDRAGGVSRRSIIPAQAGIPEPQAIRLRLFSCVCVEPFLASALLGYPSTIRFANGPDPPSGRNGSRLQTSAPTASMKRARLIGLDT